MIIVKNGKPKKVVDGQLVDWVASRAFLLSPIPTKQSQAEHITFEKYRYTEIQKVDI